MCPCGLPKAWPTCGLPLEASPPTARRLLSLPVPRPGRHLSPSSVFSWRFSWEQQDLRHGSASRAPERLLRSRPTMSGIFGRSSSSLPGQRKQRTSLSTEKSDHTSRPSAGTERHPRLELLGEQTKGRRPPAPSRLNDRHESSSLDAELVPRVASGSGATLCPEAPLA